MQERDTYMGPHPDWHENADVYDSRRAAMGPMPGGFFARISWGAVLAGATIALAAELIFIALGSVAGLSAASVANLTDLSDLSVGLGIWAAVSVLLAALLGAYVAARLSGSIYTSDGVWHGITTWSLLIVGGVLLAALGVTGVLGFGLDPSLFLIGAAASLLAAVAGGWFGSKRMARTAVMMPMEEEHIERRAA